MSGRALCAWCGVDLGERAGIVGLSHGICKKCAREVQLEDPESPVLPAAQGRGDGAADEVAPVVAGGLVQGGELGGREADRDGKAGGAGSLGAQLDAGLRDSAQDRGPHPSGQVQPLGSSSGGSPGGEVVVKADGNAGVAHVEQPISGVCRSSTSGLTL